MEYIIILIICIIAIFVLKFALDVKIKDINKVKEIGYNKDLNDITNKLPGNEQVCKDILKKLNNENVEIDVSDDKNNKVSFYIVATNKIIIANIKDTFTRIQTIAHECIHSTQNKKMLLSNFIFSNIYLIYFILAIVLTVLNVIKIPIVHVMILTILGIIHYVIRSYLETDAMTRAPYVTVEYLKETGKLSKNEIETLKSNYDILNKIGIPMTNFKLITSVILKTAIYCVISYIML